MKLSRTISLFTLAVCLLPLGFGNVCYALPAQTEHSAKAAKHTESAEEFLQRYFYTLANAKSVMEMKKFYVITNDDPKAEEMLKDPTFAKFALTMMQGEPAKVKVVSKKEEPNRVTFQLLPIEVPTQYQAQSKQPGFSMKGEAIVITDNGEWKIYKDYWTVISNDGGSKSTFRFGRDPDSKVGDRKDDSDNKSSMPPEDYDTKFRHRIMDDWKQKGKGSVYALVRVSPEGKLSEVIVGGETDQKAAFDEIKTMLSALQPFPALPADKLSTPYAWMQISWSEDGKGFSGPYFNEKCQDYILEKLKFRAP